MATDIYDDLVRRSESLPIPAEGLTIPKGLERFLEAACEGHPPQAEAREYEELLSCAYGESSSCEIVAEMRKRG